MHIYILQFDKLLHALKCSVVIQFFAKVDFNSLFFKFAIGFKSC